MIRGRITDRATGRPVSAGVAYDPFPDNPHLKAYPSIEPHDASGDDGQFEIAVPPGRGALTAHCYQGRYLLGVGAERIEGLDRIPSLARRPPHLVAGYQLVVEVNLAPGAGPVTRDLQLVPARAVTGTLIDPDGKPIVEAVAMGLDANVPWGNRVLMSADFAIEDIDPGGPRRVSFFHVGRRLAGSVLINGDEAGPLSVRLRPWGAVTGRIVDDRGRPQTGMVLTGSMPNLSEVVDSGMLPRRATVAADGRFRFEGLVPGLRYSASVMEEWGFGRRWAFRDLRVGPGETRDLGDITLQRDDPGKTN